MGQYERERNRLRDTIKALSKERHVGNSFPDTPDLDELLTIRIERELDDFERVATAHHHRSSFGLECGRASSVRCCFFWR